MADTPRIRIHLAGENNLDGISLEIPHHQLTVITGVSGSGKSSLAFEVIAKEGQRRFFETFSSYSRQFMGKMARPAVESIEGLSPVILLSQKTVGRNPRSTVGTLSDLYDHLRLLFARLGTPDDPDELPLSRGLFSFNSPRGACPQCKGLGLEEKISLSKLVVQPEKTLRDGALAPTLPTGYIMYSQVTIDVLNTVCEAHGFSVDIPWQDLTAEQQDVVLYGSTRLKVPFGKHSLESRLKWTGITAKPREEGYYKGIVTIMEDILRRDRNKNILRYAESRPCTACGGTRLNAAARGVRLHGASITALSKLEVVALKDWLQTQPWTPAQAPVATPVVAQMAERIDMMARLGIGYLSLDRPASGLSGGETQRIRLINQAGARLSQVLYVFDEPSIGLHPRDNAEMLRILRGLVARGNTVIVVEHDSTTIRQADWIVDVGPGAGGEGGKLLFSGPLKDFLNTEAPGPQSPTWRSLHAPSPTPKSADTGSKKLRFHNCAVHNLQGFTATFATAAFNVVTGVAGAGKSSLVHGVVAPAVRAKLAGESPAGAKGLDRIDQLVTIDQKPIGRTPRSNPATYTGLADRIRDLFSKTEAAKNAGFKKGRFSFNTKGGRCETCEGAGSIQMGMHLLGNVDIPCDSCQGKRFNAETLAIRFRDKNIFEVFEMRVEDAIPFFEGEKAVLRHLEMLHAVGLGYLQLGQPSTTLSGGEAQRVKLASELHKADTGRTLYLLDEPTTGLHREDVAVLMRALRDLVARGNTVICIAHDPDLILQADWIVDLGPESGSGGGQLLYAGPPAGLAEVPASVTRAYLFGDLDAAVEVADVELPSAISLRGVTTHLLQNVDVSFPRGKLTVVTGVSGSGKSSLVFDTLYAAAHSRFAESMSTHTRSLLRLSNTARMDSSEGLGPVVAIGRKFIHAAPRSTVGTLTGLDAHFRLLFSRLAQAGGRQWLARDFSFNHESGACPVCKGMGAQRRCDPARLLPFADRPLDSAAFVQNRVGKYYGDPHGRFIALLRAAAVDAGVDLDRPWSEMGADARKLVLYGTGERQWTVTWEFKNKTRSGTQELTAPWLGFCNYVEEEYHRKQHNKNISALEALMHEVTCTTCAGQRLKPELLETTCAGKNIAEVRAMTLSECMAFFEGLNLDAMPPLVGKVTAAIRPGVLELLQVLRDLGLDYLQAARTARSLSGGEGQRVRLARAFSARLYGVTYVLDEPTIGLHPKDVPALLGILRRLVAAGNTAVVVEHDATMIRGADRLIELGPGPGRQGGRIVAEGTPDSLAQHKASRTGPYLHRLPDIAPVAGDLRGGAFGLRGARKHNLQGIDPDFISGGLIAVTGVSGSGKSTLVRDVLLASAAAGLPVNCESTYGLEAFEQVVWVGQEGMARHAQSTVATWTGWMEPLRTLFAATPGAKATGLNKSAFSYLHKSGMCPECKGAGVLRTPLDFLGDVQTPCEACKGQRYRPEVLAVRYEGQSIADLLACTVAEGLEIFGDHRKLGPLLKLLAEVGLGHLQLGQSCVTLSGGEAQRLKLARELADPGGKCNLYLLDEPTTGLHFADVEVLIELFRKMVNAGHTVLVIAHHPMLVAAAAQVLTLGPGGGAAGGRIVAE